MIQNRIQKPLSFTSGSEQVGGLIVGGQTLPNLRQVSMGPFNKRFVVFLLFLQPLGLAFEWRRFRFIAGKNKFAQCSRYFVGEKTGNQNVYVTDFRL